MDKYDVDIDYLYNHSVKGVLPYVTMNPYTYEKAIKNNDCISAVIAAAEAWVLIAEQWEFLLFISH